MKSESASSAPQRILSTLPRLPETPYVRSPGIFSTTIMSGNESTFQPALQRIFQSSMAAEDTYQ